MGCAGELIMDGVELGKEMTAIVRDYVERKTSPILARLDALEHGTTKAQPQKPRVRVAARVKTMVWEGGAIYDLLPDGQTYRLRPE
jgi:hypothetical protein